MAMAVMMMVVMRERERERYDDDDDDDDDCGDGVLKMVVNDDTYLPLESALPLTSTSLTSRASQQLSEPSLYRECVNNMRRS